jgi:hypothetical protein
MVEKGTLTRETTTDLVLANSDGTLFLGPMPGLPDLGSLAPLFGPHVGQAVAQRSDNLCQEPMTASVDSASGCSGRKPTA